MGGSATGVPPFAQIIGAQLFSYGGIASQGDVNGGIGGNAGGGGNVTVNLGANFIPDSSNNLAGVGLTATSLGGLGGSGGQANGAGFYPQNWGAAGTGGNGSAVSETASGTVAAQYIGILASSGGGSGGTGGYAPTQFNSTFGGAGGNGGAGGPATLQWTGGTVTADQTGLFASSSGGPGGDGGGTQLTAKTEGGNAGAGGAGGIASVVLSGGTVTIVRTGSMTLPGAGIYAQSIGGNGGAGGLPGGALGAYGGNGGSAGVTVLGRVGYTGANIDGQVDGVGVLVQSNGGAGGEGGNQTLVRGSGGGGGFAGAGGSAAAPGEIDTAGNFAHGALVQGGGSGGGATTSTTKSPGDMPAQTSIGVGGDGGGGDGGPVTIVNGRGGAVLTQGVAAFGIFGQSVGGGEGATAGTVSGSLKSLSVGVGGNGGSVGAVSITTGDGTVTTTGKHGIAIFAQSIGGGGGLARTMTTDETFDPSKIIMNPQGRLGSQLRASTGRSAGRRRLRSFSCLACCSRRTSRRPSSGPAAPERIEIALPDGTCIRLGADVGLVASRRAMAAVRR